MYFVFSARINNKTKRKSFGGINNGRKIKKIIRKSRWKFLNLDDHEQYDTFFTACILIPADEEGTSFSLQIICGAGNSQDKEDEGINLYDESIPFTVEDFKEFLVNSYEKYPEQLDIIIPTSWDVSNYQDNELNLEEIVKIIDKAVSDRNWSLSDGCLAFRIIDRTM